MRTLPKLDAVETAVTKLNEVVTVLKAGGQLDDAALTQIGDTLDMAADLILPPAEALPSTGDKTLKQLLDGLVKALKSFGVEAQSADYALGEQADAILADAELASQMAADLPAAAPVVPPVEPAPPVADPPPAADPPPVATDPPPVAADPPPAAPPAEPPPVVAEPPVAPPVEPVAADPPPVAADPPPAEPPAEPPVEPPPAAPELDPRYATKADLTAMTEAMTETLKKALEPVTELKSMLGTTPTTQPVFQPPRDQPAPAKPRPVVEQFDMALSPELESIDEYGNIKE